jgi:TonB family protein
MTLISRFVAVAAFFGAAHAWAADTNLTGAELLERARNVSKLHAAEFQAHLDLKFVGLIANPVAGRMEFARRPSGQWHREISIPNYYREIDNSGDGVIYKDRTVEYEPLRVGFTYVLFFMATDPNPGKDVRWGKVHHDESGDCADAKVRRFEERWCFDAITGALKSVDEFSMRSEFADYQKIGDRLVPTSMRLYYKKKLAVEARATWDFDSHLQDDVFKPSAGAVDWPYCKGMVMPTEDSTPDPIYPRGKPGVTGDDADVVLYVTIAADGRLRMPYVIESGGVEFDRAAAIGVREWRFHPATCDGKPVAVQTRIEMRFHYRRGGPDMPIYR